MLKLPEPIVAHTFADAFLRPRNHYLLRVALLLGNDFCQWLYGKWDAKWQRHPQPPSFYWTFKQTMKRLQSDEPCLLAARLRPMEDVSVASGQTLVAKDLLQDQETAGKLVNGRDTEAPAGDRRKPAWHRRSNPVDGGGAEVRGTVSHWPAQRKLRRSVTVCGDREA